MMRVWTWWFGFLAALARARELDPAACASRFDVQRDKIIRTEESREMGARYLSELDVGARHECLRLCCETDACDVFVYEEKSPGSCYLFNCGPPEDFRCKFTSHGNFSSGVLALSRRLAELQDQERLSQHEQQLQNLRAPTTSTTTVRVSSSPPPTPRPTPPRHPPDHLTPPQRRCSRYQFECHSGGECIAVYNACDGIPQCSDGSDEAPELGCPPTVPPPAPTTTKLPLTPKAVAVVPVDSESSSSESGDSPAAAENHWPSRLKQAQQQHRSAESPPSSHIFSHKGGLWQDTENNVMSNNALGQYPGYEAPWPRRPWAQPAPGMEGGWGSGYPHYEWQEPDPRRAWPVPQPRPDQEMPVYMPPKTMPETANVYTNQHTLRDSPKKGFDLMKQLPDKPAPPEPSPEVKVEKTVESSTKKKELKVESPPPKVSTAPKPAHVEEVVHQHYTSADEHDGLSERPPAAVMLLVLGILMTSVMGLMLACRGRAARRRLRRGKSSAHDADYLVNGMYL